MPTNTVHRPESVLISTWHLTGCHIKETILSISADCKQWSKDPWEGFSKCGMALVLFLIECREEADFRRKGEGGIKNNKTLGLKWWCKDSRAWWESSFFQLLWLLNSLMLCAQCWHIFRGKVEDLFASINDTWYKAHCNITQMWILPWNLPVVTQRNILTIFHMKPAVTWLKNASLELYKQGEGGRERDRKSKWWLWTRVSVSCLTRRTIPTEQRGYKNTFGHLTNFRCVELFQICSLSFVRLRLRDQFRPADMEKSLAYTSISLTPIAHYSIDTHWGAHVHSSPIHTHITHNHNQDFSSSCEIKGRTSVWHYHLYYLSIYIYIFILRGFWATKYS